MERSVHDNFVYAYQVLCEARQLILHTAFRDLPEGTQEELTDVTFSGVVAHQFDFVLSANILFQIEEVEAEDVVNEHWSEFEIGRKHGWPDDCKFSTASELVRVCSSKNLKGFVIRSSCGLDGWVLAESASRKPRSAPYAHSA